MENGSELCLVFLTSLMAHICTMLAEEWLCIASFAPIQPAKPGSMALRECAICLQTSDGCSPVVVGVCVDKTELVNGAQPVASMKSNLARIFDPDHIGSFHAREELGCCDESANWVPEEVSAVSALCWLGVGHNRGSLLSKTTFYDLMLIDVIQKYNKSIR